MTEHLFEGARRIRPRFRGSSTFTSDFTFLVRYILHVFCTASEPICIKYFKIININKSEVFMDQLPRVLTRVNVNMVINLISDLWQESKSKLYC